MEPAFTWIPIGAGGGLDEDNLSAHLLAPIGSTDYICLDAGTMSAGLKYAAQKGCFKHITPHEGLSLEGTILHHYIKAYLISHPYLDHNHGMVEASPTDVAKPILSMDGPIEDIKAHIFNWRTWPNFADEGVEPRLGQYSYVRLKQGKAVPIENTALSVEAQPLAHGEHTDSVAFLLKTKGRYILYMGDTGPDEVEGRTTTEELFRRIAPLIRSGVFHGLSIESSYADEHADNMLYSHLTPKWVITALRKLAGFVDPQSPLTALKGMNVIITHIKPNVLSGETPRETVIRQLNAHNDLGVNFIFVEQGRTYQL